MEYGTKSGVHSECVGTASVFRPDHEGTFSVPESGLSAQMNTG